MTISILLSNLGLQSFGQSDDELVILHTNLGEIVIEFFPEDAPNHVENFLELARDGFYDNTLFHRIIKDFMIQGGDPKTKPDSEASQQEWGTGDPGYSINAEFNNIKHNRGIVSMARSADPNSAGSQFFIVHKDSNFLDEQYTVFGRIATQESYDTLDKIASVATGSNDRPINPSEVTITKAEVIPKSQVSDILDQGEPERTQTSDEVQGNQLYENEDLGVSFSAPAGWLLQETGGSQPGAPDVVAVGPNIGGINAVISLTITNATGSLDDLIEEKNQQLSDAVDSGQLTIQNQEKTTINNRQGFVTEATGIFQSQGNSFTVKFKEVVIQSPDKIFTLAYSNSQDNFESFLPAFDETVDSFTVLGEEAPTDFSSEEQIDSEGGGCLIATATFDTELAPQVQQLRELRDNKLLNTDSGRAFMTGFNQFYYSFSPVIADLERQNPIFKEAVKITITPMLSSLSLLNFVDVDSEHEVVGYGIGIIIMNIGMYFAGPALLIHKFRK